MATVFRARDPQLGRDVAIKVMGMAHAARGGARERFRREAHAVAALKHPGIVEIYDFVDATENEPSYIVAELIDGSDPAQADGESRWTAAAGDRGAHRLAVGRGPGRGARPRRHPPRRQARQRHDREHAASRAAWC